MKKKKVALTLAVALALIGLVSAGGLRVQPGGLLIQNVPPGLDYDIYTNTGIQLEIFNNDDREHTYTITSKKPSEVGLGVGSEYAEIPDTAWFYYSKNEVTIPANSSGSLRMFVSIPNDERYIGKKWEVIIAVEGKATGGETFSLAAFPKIQIETQKLDNSLKFSVNDRAGKPLGNVVISLNGELYRTDANGLAEIRDFAIGTYLIKVSKDGYSDASMEIVIRNTENTYEIEIDKKPEKPSNLWLYLVIGAVIVVVLVAVWLFRRKKG